MLSRCRNPKYKDYPLYGGRGISVCDDWLIFENFYRDMGDRPVGMSLDRIDNTHGYCKKNCRWASERSQQRNRRDNVFYEYGGIKATLPDLCERFGADYNRAKNRIGRGWTIERAICEPPLK